MDLLVHTHKRWFSTRHHIVAAENDFSLAEIQTVVFEPAKIIVAGEAELTAHTNSGIRLSARLEKDGEVLARVEQRGWTRKQIAFRDGIDFEIKREDLLGYQLAIIAAGERVGALHLPRRTRRPSSLSVPSSWSPRLTAFVFWYVHTLGATTASIQRG